LLGDAALHAAGLDRPPHAIQEQRYLIDGRIRITRNGTVKRGRRQSDYLLRYGPDLPIAVVEAAQ
jgi:type I restriction enzyme R subunit